MATEETDLTDDMTRRGSSGVHVLLAGEQDLFLVALRALIQNEPDMTVMAMTDYCNAVAMAAHKPDVIVLDLLRGEDHSLDLLATLTRIDGTRVLALTETDDPDLHVTAVQLGALGILHKRDSGGSLFKAIRQLHEGELWLNASLVRRVLQGRLAFTEDPEAAKIADLTTRELDVIALLCEGRKNKHIAERLFISECTVRHHLTSIFDKLALEDRLELLLYAYQNGLAKPPAPMRRVDKQRSVELFRRLSRTA